MIRAREVIGLILHTIASRESVFSDEYESLEQMSTEETSVSYKRDGERFIQCVNSNDVNTISRIISTNPKDYLNPRYSIGNKL